MKIPRTPRIPAHSPLPAPALERPPPLRTAWPRGTNPRGSGTAAFLSGRFARPAAAPAPAQARPAPLAPGRPRNAGKLNHLDSETPPEPSAPGAPFSLYSV